MKLNFISFTDKFYNTHTHTHKHYSFFFMNRSHKVYDLDVWEHRQHPSLWPSFVWHVQCMSQHHEWHFPRKSSEHHELLRRSIQKYVWRHLDVLNDEWLVWLCLECYLEELYDDVWRLLCQDLYLLRDKNKRFTNSHPNKYQSVNLCHVQTCVYSNLKFRFRLLKTNRYFKYELYSFLFHTKNKNKMRFSIIQENCTVSRHKSEHWGYL